MKIPAARRRRIVASRRATDGDVGVIARRTESSSVSSVIDAIAHTRPPADGAATQLSALAELGTRLCDGAACLGIGELYERLGYAGWFRPGAERELLAAMRARLGADRVGFSRDGFNAV